MLLGCDGLVNFGLSLGLIADHIKIQISLYFHPCLFLLLYPLKRWVGWVGLLGDCDLSRTYGFGILTRAPPKSSRLKAQGSGQPVELRLV